MNIKLSEPFNIKLSSEMTIEELFVISIGLQRIKRMTNDEINEELEYYSEYIGEEKIKQIASRLHSGMAGILRDLKLR